MKIQYHYHQHKLITKGLLLPGIISLGLGWLSLSSAQAADNFVRKADTIENDELKAFGISNPVGLTFSPKAENLLILDEPEASNEETEITAVSLEEGESSSPVTIPAEIPDPINTVFDSTQNRLLAIDSQTDILVEVDANNNGELKEQTTTEMNVPGTLSLDKPQGMTIDPETGFVYILDSGKVVRVKPLNEGGLDETSVVEVALPSEVGDPTNLRGIAFNPNDDLVYVYNLDRQKLYGVTKSGELKSTRDLSEFGLSSTQSMIFAPSGDTTDDPGQVSLYIVNQGPADNETRIQARAAAINPDLEVNATTEAEDTTPESQIVELSLVEPPALQAAASVGSLVQAMNLSQLNNPHFPDTSTLTQLGTPDSSGITYLPANDSLLIVDGEVEEVTGAPSKKYNVFEIDYNLNVADIDRLVDVFTIVKFPFVDAQFGPKISNEPTGISAVNPDNGHVFISDDDPVHTNNLQNISEVAPGPDGIFATPDDVFTTFILTDLTPGGIKDPEGVAYGEVSPGQKRIFIAGGIDNEIYWVDLGTNGILDLNDPVSQFDTFVHGLLDPEGIEFDSDTGHLYVTGQPIDKIFEFQVDGTFVQTIDISAALPGSSGVPSGLGLNQPAGLILAPGTDGSQRNLYIVDRGDNNNTNPSENDGQLFEINIGKDPASNQSPIAVSDTVATQQNTVVNGNVLDGSLSSGTADSDPDGDSIQVISDTTPGNGTLTSGVTASGNFTYMPNTGYTGPDSFDYTISDGQGGTATATVSVSVVAGNQNPTAVNDNASTPQDTAVNGNVLDGSLSGGTADSDPDGDSIQVISDTAPDNGTLTSGVTASGNFTYTPNIGYTGTDSFNYTISDGQGGTATATVNIQVLIGGTQSISSQVATSSDDAEEKDTSGNVTTTNSDLDFTASQGDTQTTGIRFLPAIPPGATIVSAYIQFTADEVKSTATSLTIKGQNSGNAPTFTSANGSISARATTGNSVTWSPVPSWDNVGDAGPAQRTPDLSSIIQEITNGSGWSSGNGLVIIVTGTGKRPAETYDADPAKAAVLHVEYSTGSSGGNQNPNAVNDNATTQQDTAVNGNVLNGSLSGGTADSDPDGDSIQVNSNTTPGNGTLTSDVTASGNFTYTPNTGYTGPDSFNYTISDGQGGTATATVSITVVAGNQNPTAVNDNATTQQDTAVNGNVLNGSLSGGTADSDPDGDSIQVNSNTTPGNGTLTSDVTASGNFTYTPNTSYTGTDSFNYTISDGQGGTATATVNIQVLTGGTQSISSQVATSSDDAEEKDTSGNVTTTNSDLDFTASQGDTQTTGIRFLPAIPPGATIVSAYIQFTADEVKSTATSLTIKGQNSGNAPTFTSANGSISARATTGNSVTWSPVPSWDNVGDAGPAQRTPDLSSIIQEITNGSGWSSGNGLVIIVTGTGKRPAETYDADPAKAAVLHVEYSTGSSGGNQNPNAVNDNATTQQDTAVNGNVLNGSLSGGTADSDPDGDSIQVNSNTTPGNGTLTSDVTASGNFTYTPNTGYTGTDSFNYTISDGQGGTATATVSITVVAGNQNPTAVNDNATTQQDTAVNGNVLNGSLSGGTADSDPDGDSIQVNSNTTPGNGTLTSDVTASGNFTYTPNTSYTGTDSFNYTISDGQGGTATATVNIQVLTGGTQSISSQVATSSDDAEEKDTSGNVTTTNSDLDFTASQGDTQTTGIRFLPAIPPGATIVSAYIQFTADEVKSTATSLTIKGQNSGNAPTFTSANGSISARATTGNSVTWSPVPSWDNVGDAGPAQRTPDLSSIIQEITNGSGWSSGNGLVIIVTGTGKRPAETYDADPAKAAVLHVEYSTGSSGGNQNPNAVNDNATTQQDTAVNGNVLNGSLSGGTADSDPDGDSIQVNSNTTPGNGTLTSDVTASGNFTYTPNTGYTGTDSFNYTISDGQGGTDTATVNIQVQSGGGNQTISSQVATSSDDAEEKDSSGNVTTNNGDLDLTESGGGTQTTGIRFLPAIPPGATIVSAYIQFTADEVRSSATSLTIKGQNSGNAPTFTSANGSISARATTGSSVTWSSVPSWNNIGDAGVAQRTPDLSSIIQEVVNGSGWSSGNGLAIIITGTGKRPAETYDAAPAKAAVLHVEYQP